MHKDAPPSPGRSPTPKPHWCAGPRRRPYPIKDQSISTPYPRKTPAGGPRLPLTLIKVTDVGPGSPLTLCSARARRRTFRGGGARHVASSARRRLVQQSLHHHSIERVSERASQQASK
eukprot:scaffold218_cov333-Prasinococcus_capsulatus_cf.AAC.18